MKTIAFFDFDGTLTLKDTLVDFTRYAFGTRRFFLGLFLLIPAALPALMKVASRDAVARCFIRYFYKGRPKDGLETIADRYVSERIPRIINPGVYGAFQRHKENKDDIVVVSASPAIWLKSWCRQQGAGLIATRLEDSGGIFTGNVVGKRCIGKEKVSRIRQEIPLSDYNRIIAYGNSDGDLAMLDMADEAYYVTGIRMDRYRPRQ